MYYEAFHKLCEQKGVKPARVSKETGISTATLTSWKQGKYTPKQDKLQKIADYFEVPLSEITGRSDGRSVVNAKDLYRLPANRDEMRNTLNALTGDISLRITKKIPVLGRVAAGIPIMAVENILDWEEISGEMALDGEYFALQIKGDSMEPRICNGDVVIVREQPDADDGDIVIALVNGDDAVCKRLKKYQDGVIALVSLNPIYDPMVFSEKEIDETPIRIIGKVKELRGKF